ncbi:hypothetical protein LEMA_P120030.1 [Plenodomus lingam JN3]|uniref:Uncharacterized protein n=1 Tax=Leptosphaeria maculans (strain JN3 / isolate v23.1.3 / race Av1-4-5-6-7-8) TaxID=985895 RepID=E4ZSS4_LEPMJ|nr:hypothetical protein LEMA_P120030.1 [Plenodomus lingam JN3]CBX94512.1 hypothetical protein LEMA_P120030.1 [Plenodomus lingam JN3]
MAVPQGIASVYIWITSLCDDSLLLVSCKHLVQFSIPWSPGPEAAQPRPSNSSSLRTMPRRTYIPTLAVVIITITILFLFSSFTQSRQSWRHLPQQVHPGQHVGEEDAKMTHGNGVASKGTATDPDYVNWNPRPLFKQGTSMPPGHNYTSMLVIAKTREENVDWILHELPDQPVAAYVADDPNAPMHAPKNKGHEVMVYLSWIIDNYDNLPDVTMFMHAHQIAWHNDALLDSDARLLITRLSRPRVWREGFVNMRCTWHPGCPDWIHPGKTEMDPFKEEEHLIAKSWSELFPLDEVPTVLATPCCAQFALSRDRIQARPYAQYLWYRDWLFNSRLPDHLSGRMWEYVWQFVFTGSNVYCPKEHLCFCDQYGTCFGSEEIYADFIALATELSDREGDVNHWREQKSRYEEYQSLSEEERANYSPSEGVPEEPDEEKLAKLQKVIDRLKPLLEKMKADAEERGKDPENRALEAGREWHEGDGF